MKTLLTLFILSAALAHAAMILRDPFYAASISSASVSWVQPISTIVTDASATPTTTNLTLTGGANAFRVWTGETSYTEPGFDLYVRTNAGNVVTVRLYRWTARIIYAPPGSAISLGTVDGRTLQATPIYVPSSLPAPSGATGNANCDKAGPPLWTPQNAHITLPTDGSSFVVKSNTSESILFISEYDGTTWSYPRFLWVQTNYDITVQATYKRVALANYDGTVQSIVAPTGSTIGGTSNYMRVGTFTVTGTSRVCDTVGDFQTAISNAVAGDEIVLHDGTYALTTNVVNTSFAANHGVGGQIGASGIMIRGTNEANRDATIITMATTNTGEWLLTHTGAVTTTTWFKNIAFAFSNIHSSAPFTIKGGKFKFENVHWYGPQKLANGQLVQDDASGFPVQSDYLWCQADNSAEDCFGAGGHSTQSSTNANSRLRYIGCSAFLAGPSSPSQCLTTHNGLTNYVYGGHWYDASNNIIANGAIATDFTYCNFIRTDPGTRQGRLTHVNLFACDAIVDNLSMACTVNSNGYVLFTKYVPTNGAASSSIFLNSSANIIANRLYCTNSRAIQGSKDWVIARQNIIDSFGTGMRLADYTTGLQSNLVVLNNTLVGCATAFYLNQFNTADPAVSNWFIFMTNNATATSGAGVTLASTTMTLTNIQHDFNTLDPTISTNFVPASANETTNANAALTAWWFPTASGNCDGTGATNIYNWVGDSDPYGFVFIYHPNRVTRGAREIPAIYAGAVLYPDIW